MTMPVYASSRGTVYECGNGLKIVLYSKAMNKIVVNLERRRESVSITCPENELVLKSTRVGNPRIEVRKSVNHVKQENPFRGTCKVCKKL